MESRATATWEGDLINGHGTTAVASGVLEGANLSWKARTEGAAAHTTPEELLAASHASCLKSGGGFEVKSSKLTVKGWVPELDQTKFIEFAESAKNGCPISSIMKNNVHVSADVLLQG